ncbi:MAG: DUF4931 domain-containing protein [Ilumatobacter sp.]
MPEVRHDPFLGTRVLIDGSRLERPTLPTTGCPFCVGGLESPEPYRVKSFPNRWPALGPGRCEVVLYTSDHDATFPSLGAEGAREVIDLWAERTMTLGAADDVDYVLVFENRGPAVGATITHPHGQIYAFDHVPDRPARVLAAGWRPDDDPGERAVCRHGSWSAWIPEAPTFPLELHLAPTERRGGLVDCDDADRDDLAGLLVDVLDRLDRLFEEPLPYMLWLYQRPTVAEGYDDAWFHIRIVSPWRGKGLMRFIAAAELATDEYINEIVPESLASRLRAH